MADIMAAEMRGDAEEMAQFRAGTKAERRFLYWKQVFDLKKYCALALVLALLLAVQLLQLAQMANFTSPENLQKVHDLYRHYYPVDNATAKATDAAGGE
jgi:hypothetical protein